MSYSFYAAELTTGLSLDREGNVWEGGGDTNNVYRYTPDRSIGMGKTLGAGYWTAVVNPGGARGSMLATTGVAVDTRGGVNGAYFAWVARSDMDGAHSWIVGIPASTVPVPVNADTMIDGAMFPAAQVAGFNPWGTGIDVLGNVYTATRTGSVLTRVLVDQNGALTAPDLRSPPAPAMLCPSGDRCALKDNPNSDPATISSGDFTGAGHRNIAPSGVYSFVVDSGCGAMSFYTRFVKITWDADVPQGTSLAARARAGSTLPPMGNAASWVPWTLTSPRSPLPLFNPAPRSNGSDLAPAEYHYLQVEFSLAHNPSVPPPVLKNVNVTWVCVPPP